MLDAIPLIVQAGLAIVLGFIGLIWSADRFVAGAASIASSFGIAPAIVGLTIVSFGTSAPEVMVSLMASLDGAGDLAIGNALGSNIANIGLVLGATLLITYIPVQARLLKHEGAVLLFLSVLAGVFLFDGGLSRLEGWILLALLVPSIWLLSALKQRDYDAAELIDEQIPHYSRGKAIAWFLVGLSILIVSSKILVWGAETTAIYFKVSPLIIGLTVVAIGTSLPELAASVVSALKGHHDIAIGNIIGSNIFNLLAVMSIPGIFVTKDLVAEVFSRDFATMMVLTLVLLGAIGVALMRKKTATNIGKPAGLIMLFLYLAYIVTLASSEYAKNVTAPLAGV